VRSVVTGAVAVASLVAFVRIERAQRNPLVALGLLRNRPYVALTVTGAVVNTATVVFLFVVPLALQGQWRLSVLGAGTAFLAPAVLMAVAGVVAGRVRSADAVPVMAGCLVVCAVALHWLATASGPSWYVAATVLCAAPLGLANALTLVATQGAVRPERAGEASGVTKTVITVAAGLGVALCGPVADGRGDAGPAANAALLSTAAICLVVGLALAGWWYRARRLPGSRTRRPLRAATRPAGSAAVEHDDGAGVEPATGREDHGTRAG
jgi:predicted MFS family arabinose efflux permease